MLESTQAWTRHTDSGALSVNGYVGPDEIVLALSGEADVASAPLLGRVLSQACSYGHTRIALDLAGLDFINSHCLSLILGTRDMLRDRGADLVLRAPRSSVRRILGILQQEDVIEST